MNIPNYIYRPAISKKSKLGQETGHLNGIAYLWPGKVCHDPSQCYESCYAHHGRLKMNESVLRSRSELFLKRRDLFISMLEIDLLKHIEQAKKLGLRPCFRLNGTSDISTQDIGIVEKYREVQFYDYTKNFNEYSRNANYYLIYSYNGKNWGECWKKLRDGFNIAMVFDKIPKTFKGFKVIDGDTNDLRFLDASGLIVGLKPKGKLIKNEGIKWKAKQ